MAQVGQVQDVCPLSRMFADDPDKIYSRWGIIECLDAKNETNPLCEDCTCRELQFLQGEGSLISWGLCVKNQSTDMCSSPRVVCNAPVASVVPLAPQEFRPGDVASPQPTNNISSNSKLSATIIALVVCSVVLALAAAAFALFRKRRAAKPLVFPPSPTDFSYTASIPPLKFSTPRFVERGPKAQHYEPHPPSPDDHENGSMRDTFEADDFVSKASWSERQRDVVEVSDSERTLGPHLRTSFVSFIGDDTMRSVSVDDHVRGRNDEATGRSQFTVDEGSEATEDRLTIDFTTSSVSDFTGIHWSRTSEDSALFSVSSGSVDFSEESSSCRSLEI